MTLTTYRALNDDAPALEELLRRPDTWRGYTSGASTAPAAAAADTGFTTLNDLLVDRGWPKGRLVEIGQPRNAHFEWFLLSPTLQALPEGMTFLLNPPAIPCAHALIQAGIDLNRLVVVEAAAKADFVAGFLQLVRSRACAAVLAWVPQQPLAYPELRKCQLAASDGEALNFLFRPAASLQQASPAALRLALEPSFAELRVRVLRQRGALLQPEDSAASLPLPRTWLGGFAFHAFGGDRAASTDSVSPLLKNNGRS